MFLVVHPARHVASMCTSYHNIVKPLRDSGFKVCEYSFQPHIGFSFKSLLKVLSDTKASIYFF